MPKKLCLHPYFSQTKDEQPVSVCFRCAGTIDNSGFTLESEALPCALLLLLLVLFHFREIFVFFFCQGGTMLGPPDTVVELGETEVTEEIFMDYLSSLGESTYRSEKTSFPLKNTQSLKEVNFSAQNQFVALLFLLLFAQRWQVSFVWAQLQHFHQWGGSVPDWQFYTLLHHRPAVWSPFHVSLKLSKHSLVFSDQHYTKALFESVELVDCTVLN